jgi:SAM-dependent methyltransferase
MQPQEISSLLQLDALLARIRQAPNHLDLQWQCGRLLKDLANRSPVLFAAYQPVVYEVLQVLFSGHAVSHQTLTLLSVQQLKFKYQIGPDTEPAKNEGLLLSLAQDGLFLATLEKTLNTDYEFECFLRRLRQFLLYKYRPNKSLASGLLPLAAAVAQQCFNNEYIWIEEDHERITADEIEVECFREFRLEMVKACEDGVLVLAMYRSLTKLPSIDSFAKIPLEAFSEPARPAIVRMIHEPLEEKRLLRDIPSFGSVLSPTSKVVRAQYEDNPYPRWFKLGGRFSPLEAKLKKIQPGFSWPTSFLKEKFQILVPGCGTGQHPLSIAAGNPDAALLAIDLSRASLAYGRRMADCLKLQNVTFLHGDFLDIPKLNRRFHHIDCVGVLHHLKDPLAGWRVLAQVVLPGGTLHIGVYSRVARLQVEFIRSEISRRGLRPSVQDMRELRQQILTEKEYKPLVHALNTPGFYGLSSLRDLFFNVQECSYTLSEIKQLIDSLNLEFLGFKLGSPPLKAEYRKRFPDDLCMNSFDNWRRFESSYAGSALLFDFWLRKPVLPDSGLLPNLDMPENPN